ncbi:MAG TPA: aconitase family protein [Streptosporangiaceae bacterium]|nr:aconitase family protein [Streptosporangiaceae bacterium]
MPADSFGAGGSLAVDGISYRIFRLGAIGGAGRLPFSLKVLLENLLRNEDGRMVTAGQIQALADWDPAAEPSAEIAFTPARVLMQDFTGVPCIVDLAAMREAMAVLGGDPARINPLRPAELIIDHSVIADYFGRPGAMERNIELEYQRNRERYQFLRWGQGAFRGLRVVPPGTGICHQVNIEHLARVVFAEDGVAFPDTLVGTDSHTPMVNGLGVLGWGVGGIEAEAAMLGQPMSTLIPRVVGVRLSGELPEASTATDLVLTIAETLRATGVVGAFVEFCGPGVAAVPVANRATIGNMSPEYGSTCAIFPIDAATLSYLRLTGRPPAQVALVEAYAREQGLWHDPDHEPAYSQTLDLDLSAVVPSIAGPKRPQDRIPLSEAPQAFRAALHGYVSWEPVPVGLDESGAESFPASDPVAVTGDHDGDQPAAFPGAAAPSGNRNFEGRIHPGTKMNYLASPPLVVAYALAGTMDTDLTADPLGTGSDGQPVYLRDIWPSPAETGEIIASCLRPEIFTRQYAEVFAGDERWRGQEYGSGSSRDWAAKGTALLGVRAVLAASYERIHRSNLIGMGVLPLQFAPGEHAAAVGLSGEETFTIRGLASSAHPPRTVTVTAAGPGGTRQFTAIVRIDTPGEAAYYRHGGILPYVLRSLAAR